MDMKNGLFHFLNSYYRFFRTTKTGQINQLKTYGSDPPPTLSPNLNLYIWNELLVMF